MFPARSTALAARMLMSLNRFGGENGNAPASEMYSSTDHMSRRLGVRTSQRPAPSLPPAGARAEAGGCEGACGRKHPVTVTGAETDIPRGGNRRLCLAESGVLLQSGQGDM
mmetsp:Transcript_22731/g.73474  ORF Transcript_22731/g.73474 Transcript_22731/m.73474 type:complete len:111 (-) Transcript_22731:3581-3913(-)